MRFTLLILLSITYCGQAFSQKNATTYGGSVKDSQTTELIPFATIAIYNNALLIDGTSTDANGEFQLTIDKKWTHLKVSFIGYETIQIDFENITHHNDIQITLHPVYNNLDEVVIQAEKTTTELKIDRKIINLGADLQQSGNSALEAFDQIPEIETDLGTGVISLRGAGNVRILVNGKPSPLNASELLEQIPASSIDKIEIITSPSAKHQANGLSGIINISLKKNINFGFNLNLNSSVGTKRYRYGMDSNYNFSRTNIRLSASDGRRTWIANNGFFSAILMETLEIFMLLTILTGKSQEFLQE